MAVAPKLKFRSGKPTNAQRLVGEALLSVAIQLQTWLFDADRVATGEAINTILIEAFKKGSGAVYVMSVSSHFEWALTGRGPGGFPWDKDKNVNPLIQWTIDKGLSVPAQFNSRESFAWVIANNIKLDGTKPPHFDEAMFDQIVDRTYNKFIDLMGDQLLKEHTDNISKIFTAKGFKTV